MLLAVGQCTLCSLFPKLTIIPLFHTVYHQKQHVQFPLSKYFKTIKSWAFLGLQGLQIKTSPPKMFISQVKYVSFNVCILTPSYTHRSVCVFVCVVCLSAQDLSSQRSHEMKTTFRPLCPLPPFHICPHIPLNPFIFYLSFSLPPPRALCCPRLCFIYVSVESLSTFFSLLNCLTKPLLLWTCTPSHSHMDVSCHCF